MAYPSLESRISDACIVTTALSLGPCGSKHILEELAIPVTPENIQRVVETLVSNGFERHGSFWFF